MDSTSQNEHMNDRVSENIEIDKNRVTSKLKREILGHDEIEYQLLLHFIELTETLNAEQLNQLLQRLKATLGSTPFLNFYWFMKREKAATWATIRRETNLSNSSINISINKAIARDIIEKTGKQRLKGLKGGPRPTIVYLKDLSDPEKEIRKAAIKHVHQSQGFNEIYRLTQLLLEQLKAKPVLELRHQVSRNEILVHIRRNAKPGYHVASLAGPIMTMVSEEGITVWR